MPAPAELNYTFNERELAMLKPYGTIKSDERGDLIIPEGGVAVDCLVTLSGLLLKPRRWAQGQDQRCGHRHGRGSTRWAMRARARSSASPHRSVRAPWS